MGVIFKMPGLMNEEHTFLYDYGGVIPQTVTISSYTTAHEQLRLSSDNLTKVMVESILPECIDPKIPVKELYEPDFWLLLRHLRMVTWGPYYTPRHYVCPDCKNEEGTKGAVESWEGMVNLADMAIARPDDAKELITTKKVSHDKFLFLDADVEMHLNKCKDLLLIENTKVSDAHKKMLPLAASISSVSDTDFVAIEEVVEWLSGLMPADFEILTDEYTQAFKFGLTNRCNLKCPKCGGAAWAYVPINDNYFRPTRENLTEWKHLLADSKSKVRSGKQ